MTPAQAILTRNAQRKYVLELIRAKYHRGNLEQRIEFRRELRRWHEWRDLAERLLEESLAAFNAGILDDAE